MYLSKNEEKMYNGEYGETIETLMKILVSIGDIYKSDKLIPINNVHLSGVSYKTIGDAGISWISSINKSVSVNTTLNPCGFDLQNKKNNILNNNYYKQIKIINIFRKMGVKITCTCTPYYLKNENLNSGDHVSWCESSAVIYANSILGYKTNREGGPSAIASAIIGKTPNYGLHIDENRIPTVKFNINISRKLNDLDYNILGLMIGKLSKTNIPLIKINENPHKDYLKLFGASMASSGNVPMYYIQNLSYNKYNQIQHTNKLEIVDIDNEEYKHYIESIYNNIDTIDFEIIVLGCPHTSEDEIRYIEKFLENRKVEKELLIFTSRFIYNKCYKSIKKIQKSKAKVICDTCIVVSDICEMYNKILVNSGKSYTYLKNLTNKYIFISTTFHCLEISIRK